MRKKKARQEKQTPSVLLLALFSAAFLLTIYLVRTTDKLIEVQAANAEAARQIVLPVVPTGGSCGT